jgi:DNA polymerase elongation subunit (family B)
MQDKEIILLKQRKKELELRLSQLNSKQQATKTLLNSVYGAFGSKHSLIGDDDIASSITLTGQSAIRKSRDIFAQFFTERTGITDEDIIEDHLVAGDTDSLFVSMAGMGVNFFEDGKVTKEGYEIVSDFQKYLNVKIKEWSEKTLLSRDNRLEFKREAIADVGVFTQKKRYVIHILDNKGIPCDKWKYVGVEIVQASITKFIKKYIKDIIHNIIISKDSIKIDNMFNQSKIDFCSTDVSNIATTKGISNLEKYAEKCDELRTCKGMPINAKAAYYYNYFLKEFNIENIYEPINSGDKLKIVYVKEPNVYNISVIGYKSKLPKEFLQVFEVDYDKMFSKTIYPVVKRFYSTMDWQFSEPNEQFKNKLENLFS